MEKELIVKWRIKESETERILKLLPDLAAKSQQEEGNVFYAIYRSENNPHEFILHERYVDAKAAEAHKKSDHYQEIVVSEILPHLEIRDVTVVKKML